MNVLDDCFVWECNKISEMGTSNFKYLRIEWSYEQKWQSFDSTWIMKLSSRCPKEIGNETVTEKFKVDKESNKKVF